MILRFKTKVNRNGNIYYLNIDTEAKTFDRFSSYFASDFVAVVKKSDINDLIKQVKQAGFEEVTR